MFSKIRSLGTSGSGATPRRTRPHTKLPLCIAILSVLTVVVTLILALLCLFAGNHPNFMEDYAIFTLNVSRIGENLKQDLDSAIMDIHIKRSIGIQPVSAPFSQITPTATKLLEARLDLTSDIKHGFGQATSDVKHGIGHATSEIAGAATAAVGDLKSDAVKAVNEAYENIIDHLKLDDFYSIHMMTTCNGTYVTSLGKNITVGGTVLADNGTTKHVDGCETHSDADPVQLLKLVYIAGIILIGIELLAAFWGTWEALKVGTSNWVPFLNVFTSTLGCIIIGLGSAVTTGIAVGASKLVNFVGEDIGIAGYAGDKFLALTWAVTALLAWNVCLWIVSWGVLHKMKRRATDEQLAVNMRPIVVHYPQRSEAH